MSFHEFEEILLPKEIRKTLSVKNKDLWPEQENLEKILVKIDKKLVPLIIELWEIKIWTRHSCQGFLKNEKGYTCKKNIPEWWKYNKSFNFAYIQFLDSGCLEKFLNITKPTKRWLIEKPKTIRFPSWCINKILKDIKAHAK